MTEEEKKKIEEQQANAVVPDVNAVEQPTVAENATVAPEVQQQPESQRYLDEIFKRYDERKKENERADKRDRIREAIGGIGDVASALAKLHYTTEYAPYVPSENMSDKARQRAALAKANRDKNLDQWMHYVLNVAGKKQAAEQAAERNRLMKDHYDQQAKIAEDKAKAAEAAAKAKAEAAEKETRKKEAASYAKTLTPGFTRAAWDGTLNREEAEKDLKSKLDAGEITLEKYNAAIDALNAADEKVKTEKVKMGYRQQHSGGHGGSGASGIEFTTNIPGEIITWPATKKGEQNLRKVYDKLPRRAQLGGRKANAAQMRSSIGAFFVSPDWDGELKAQIRDVLIDIRDSAEEAQTTQGGGKQVNWTGESKPASKGKTINW